MSGLQQLGLNMSCVTLKDVTLTCQSEQRGLAETVGVSEFKQVEAGQSGVQEEARFCVWLKRVVARDPGVPVEDEGGSVPECITVLPLGQPDLAAGTRVQEVVWSVGCFEGNPRCICGQEKGITHHTVLTPLIFPSVYRSEHRDNKAPTKSFRWNKNFCLAYWLACCVCV